MYKILIVDDRVERKKSLLDDNSIKALDEFQKKGVVTFKTSLSIDSTLPLEKFNDKVIGEYHIVAIHRSWLSQNNLINIFEEYIKVSKKFFIVFSGGTTTNGFSNNFRSLTINAGKFYSSRLLSFLKDCENDIAPSLLRFMYGNSWKLPLLLEYRNILWSGQAKINLEKEEQLKSLFGSVAEDITAEYIDKQIEKEKLNFILL